MAQTMPKIEISFRELAASFITRGQRSIVYTILKDTLPSGVTNPITVKSNEDIPDGLSDFNTTQLKKALIGGSKPPKKVIAYVQPADSTNYKEGLDYGKTINFQWLFIPTVETDKATADVVSYVKAQREDHKLIKAVLPNTKGDDEGIINFTTASLTDEDGKTFTAEQYCGRIAGLIAGTPVADTSAAASITYAPLTEVVDCTHLSEEDMDTAVGNGELIAFWDGEKVKMGRGVDSLVTLTGGKNTQFQKIRIVEAMDMIADDIKKTGQDSYIGKYVNSYDNKCLLISAISSYLQGLADNGVIETDAGGNGEYTIGIDTHQNELYLKGEGKNTDSMTEDEIKRANTGPYVYLIGTLSLLDAMEDIILPFTI